MDTNRVLYFLGLLNRETTGHSRELLPLYQQALDLNDNIQTLKSLLNTQAYSYYRETGGNCFRNGERALRTIYQSPESFQENVPLLQRSVSEITAELRSSYDLLYSPFPTRGEFSILKKRDADAARTVYERIANVCVYLIAHYEGLSPLRYLSWNSTAGLLEMSDAVNNTFLPALSRVRIPSYGWIITKHPLGGKALFEGQGFFLSYDYTQSIEDRCQSLRKEPIGSTDVFLNPDALRNSVTDVPFCWGMGNVLSVRPQNGAVFLQSGIRIANKLRSPNQKELEGAVPSPWECLKKLSDGAHFCITPEEFLITLNRWWMGHEISLRKMTHSCLFCGQHLSENRLVCRSCFTPRH